jgi:hypothetical protein
MFCRSQNIQAKSDEVEEAVNLSPNVVRDMLDIKVLSMIKDGKVTKFYYLFALVPLVQAQYAILFRLNWHWIRFNKGVTKDIFPQTKLC